MAETKERRKRKYSRRKGASVVRGAVKKHLIEALKLGVPYRVACDIVKVNQTTVDRARRANPQLDQECRAAEGELIRGLSSTILVASKNGQWTASAWMLERRWPQHFAKVERQEVSGPGGAPLAITSASQDEYVRAVRRALGFNDDAEGAELPCANVSSVEVLPPDNQVGRNLMPAGGGDTAGEQGRVTCSRPLDDPGRDGDAAPADSGQSTGDADVVKVE